MKTDGRSLLFPLLAAALLLTPEILSAQQRGSGRKEEIRVPSAALKPFHTADFFSGEVKKFKDFLESLELPPTLAEFQQKASDYDSMTGNEIRTRLANFRVIVLHPDLEEVTRLSRNWYGQVYNAALPLQTIVLPLNNMLESEDGRSYQAVKKILDDAKAETLALLKKPKKLSGEELEIIAAKNRERRKKEFVKWYRAKQAEELKKAREKAAGKKKSDKPKKKPRETEEK